MIPRLHLARLRRALLHLGLLLFTTVLIGGMNVIPSSAEEVPFAPDEVAAQLREDRVAIDPSFTSAPPVTDIQPLIEKTRPAVYLVLANGSDLQTPRDHLRAVRRAMGVPGTYVGLYGDQMSAVSDDIDSAALSEVIIDLNDVDDDVDRVIGFVVRADKLNGGSAVSAPDEDEEGGSDFFGNPWVWIVIMMGGVAVIAIYGGPAAGNVLGTTGASGPPPTFLPGTRAFGPGSRRRRWDQVPAQETWEESGRLDDAWVRAEQAITRLGEELSALPIDLSDDRVDSALRQHVQDALQCYELAKRGLEMHATRQTQVATAETWIEDGEHHLAAVNAILTGAPEPAPPEGHRLHRPH